MLKNTPIEQYFINDRLIWVKREDKCIDKVSFSKLRGVEAHLRKIPQKVVGVLDSLHSKAGWGVAYLSSYLNKQTVVFYPHYKGETGLRENQINSQALGAILEPLAAGRSCILYHRAKKILKEKYIDSYMLPNALKLQESIDETTLEVDYTSEYLFSDTTWIVSISSGTLAIGVIQGLINHKANVNVILHMGYSRPESAVTKYINSHIKEISIDINISFIDEKYNYADKIKDEICLPSFDCNEFYDRKAWLWLTKNYQNIKTKNILFWNIGK